jgi:hypothetical protein
MQLLASPHRRWFTVSSNDLLPLYCAIRSSIVAIHDLATGIDEDVGRRQIYGEPDAIARALERMCALATTIELLENQLSVCANSTTDSQRNIVEEVIRSQSGQRSITADALSFFALWSPVWAARRLYGRLVSRRILPRFSPH